MIATDELRRRARELSVEEEHVRRDYILCHVLAAMAQMFPELVFRGGTALARVYWPDYRLSEDLDFIANESPSDFQTRLEAAISQASQQTRWDLSLDFGRVRSGWSRSTVRSEHGELLIDLNVGERAFLNIESQPVTLPYSDLHESPRTVSTVALAEILGNKWYMLGDNERREPRDLYDVWAALKIFGVAFRDIAMGHKAKYGYLPQLYSLKRARQLENLWDQRLGHQLANLPTFGDVYAHVLQAFEDWEQTIEG